MDSNVMNYLNAMHQAELMLKAKIISLKDYGKIEVKMAKKYNLNSLSLFRQNDLIKKKVRAIYMIPKKEVD